MPEVRLSIKRLQAPVANLAAIKAISVADVDDGVLIHVKTLKRLYHWDATSAATPNDTTVILSDTSATGRWLAEELLTIQMPGLNALIISTADAAISARRNVEGGVVGVEANFEIGMLNGGGGEPPGTIESRLYHQNTVPNVKYRFAVRPAGEYAIADSTTMLLKQDLADKNQMLGYPGLDGYRIQLGSSLAGANISYLTHTNDAPRTYTFPDRSITIGHAIGIDEVTGTTHALVTNTHYFCYNAGLTTLTLPTSGCVVGDEILVAAATGSGGWKIDQNSGQTIRVGNQITTGGVGGSIASTAVGDVIKFTCTVANTTFQATSMIGNLTLV